VPRRTPIQLALLVVALVVWAIGQRTENSRLQYIGLGFFFAAFILRFFKHRDPPMP
jgi:multisubunit Na+/H+ antiporter MnhE subunit